MTLEIKWFNGKLYSKNHRPKNKIIEYPVQISRDGNIFNTNASITQIFNYTNGYGLVQNIFTNKELIEWLTNFNKIDYKKYKQLVSKVEIL